MEKESLTEVDGVDVEGIHGFPFSGVKALGGIHLGLGIASILLGTTNVVTYVILDSNSTIVEDDLKEKQKLSRQFAISSTPIWCGIWFCMCGGVALNISRQNRASIYCFKTSFLVLSILCATVFGPASLAVNGYEAYLRHRLFSDDFYWLIPLLIAFLALNEVVFSVVSAIVCCCCATLKESKVRVFITSTLQNTGREDIYPIQNNSPARPINPHLQRGDSTDPADMFRTSNSYRKPPPPMFSTKSVDDITRPNFTSRHLINK